MSNYDVTPRTAFTQLLLRSHPGAIAWVNGSEQYPDLSGAVRFYHTSYGGVLVEAEIFGFPNNNLPGSSNFYAMHIHESGDCSDHFSHTGQHYNPQNALHPDHAGDMPPLLGNEGYAFSIFYDKRYTIQEIIGRSVIIHEKPDDFTSQPAGNAGDKIGCGTIEWTA